MLEYPRAVPAMHQQPDHGATPQVPSGWEVRWNDQYQTWFYVNTHTSVSQWHPPTEPVFPPGTGHANPTPPRQDARPSLTDDEALARRLQAEEDAMSGGGMGMGMGMGMSAHDQHPPAQPPRPHSGAGYDGFAPAAPQVPYGVHHSAAGASGGVDAGYAPGAYAETPPGRHSGSFSSTGGPIDPSYHQHSGGGGGNRQSRLLGKVYDKVGGKLAVAGVGAGALRPSSSSGRLSPYPQDHHQQHQQHPQRPTSAGGYYPDTHSHGPSNGGSGGKKSNKKKYLAALGLGGGAAAVGGGAGAAGYYGGQELSDGLGDGIDGGKESRLSKYGDKYGSKIAKKLFKDSGHGEEEGGEGGEGGGGGGEEDDGGDDGGLGEVLGEGVGEGSGEGVGEVISALLGG